MFKKFSPASPKTATVAKKTAVKGKAKTAVKASQKKLANKLKKTKDTVTEVKKTEETVQEAAPAEAAPAQEESQ